MYSKMFELIAEKLNLWIDEKLELVKIEIKGIKVKLVFLDRDNMKVLTVIYQFDLLDAEPKLKLKKDYVKPFNDKYFR